MKILEFPNMIPEDLLAWFKPPVLENRNGKWAEVRYDGTVRSGSGRYDFVTKDVTIYIVKAEQERRERQIGHFDLARGKNVNFAGQIQFSGRRCRGQIRWWSNHSGHYRPTPAAAHQADLPLELFRPVTGRFPH